MRRAFPFRRLATGLVVVATIASACGTDDSSSDSADSAPETSAVAGTAQADITSVGHGSGDTEGHELAVGDNTPKDPKGRFFLHQGDTGPDVETLQNRLIELGAPISGADGIYGDHTLHAVMAFQRSEGITADGVVGTATWAALDAPTKDVVWEEPQVPAEYATDSPAETATEPAQNPEAEKGDGHAAGSQKAPPADPASGGSGWARAEINLSTETATFYDGTGNVMLNAPISSGKNGLTPVGTFHVQSKNARAWAGSNGVYMNSMTRFNGGIGFHSIPKRADGSDIPTPLGQQAVSHGCVRMNDAQALQVFKNLPIGAVVEVHR